MQYVKVENGQVVSTNLPKVGKLKNGKSVSGYDRLKPEVLKAEGWLPLVNGDVPEYNPETQTLQHNGYVITANSVHPKYRVVDIVVPEPKPYMPTVEDRVTAVENALLMII